MKVDFYHHSLGSEERDAVSEVLNSLFLGTGPKTKLFEDQFAAYMGQPYCAGVSSCTAGMFLILTAWGIGAGDKVIVPAMTFIATPNAVLHSGADVVFADVDPVTCLIDVDYVESILKRDAQVKAIMPVHLYGQMADMRSLRRVADTYGVKILEDSAHCVEGDRDGVRPGGLGDAAAFSFYATKNLSSGEGGAVISGDQRLIEQIKVLRRQGMTTSSLDRHIEYNHWDMHTLGYKASMFDIQASLLLIQLKRLEVLWEQRELIARTYETAFTAAHIEFPHTASEVKHTRHLFTVWSQPEQRDSVLQNLQRDGVGVTVNYNPPHLMSFYRKKYGHAKGDFPHAERIGECTITLPMYPSLSDAHIAHVMHCVQAHLGSHTCP